MKNTIAFSNKNNMWTSKYDYVSSNYSSIDKKFFSSNKLTGGNSPIAWQHNKGSINSFYNNIYPSTVAVSFAGNPSQNKLYKSMSIEGNGRFDNSVNAFTTSDFISASGERQYINAGVARNYGGNYYGHIGNDPRIKPTADLKYLGMIGLSGSIGAGDPIQAVGDQLQLFKLPIIGSAISVGQSDINPTKLLFKANNVPTNIASDFGYNEELMFINGANFSFIDSDTSYQQVATNIHIATAQDLATINKTTAFQQDGIIVKIGTDDSLYTLLTFINQLGYLQNGGISVFGLVDPKHSGDMMRGQFAEAHFTFTAEPFELFSLNLNYEPTDLDHSK